MCRLSTNGLTTTGEKKILLSPSLTASIEASALSPSPTSPALPTDAGRATIAKSLEVKGEVICSGWLYIGGKVEGSISQPGGRVTVSRDAQVAANISAREVVVLGKVRGNIDASDRVDMRSESSLIGDVITQSISIGDGAFFNGSMEIGESARQIDGRKP
jgi:cytoskeletal protein CcmA (bactofilin family)